MQKRETVTKEQIKQDIIQSIKKPPHESKVANKRWTFFAIVIAVLALILEYVYPKAILGGLLILLISIIPCSVISHFQIKHRIKAISMDDYEIKTDVISHTESEHYKTEAPRGRKRVSNYTLYFESGAYWCIPPEIYCWSERKRSSARGVHQTAHCGDVFIVVLNKNTGEIAMAYDTEFFTYKENQQLQV